MSDRTVRLYVFLVCRPCDHGRVWATVFTERERAERYPHRVSPVVEVFVLLDESAALAGVMP